MENIIKIECRIYKEYMFNSKSRFIFSRIKREPVRMIWIWQYYSRKTDYYKQKAGVFAKLLYLFFYMFKKQAWRKTLFGNIY